ncbi:hypothetical protein B7494_g6421 [Chlorociboria aeruginascens]|nr:hypothetical protein B7494_g6421 [Chlorociboria aeruginascens]
MSFVSYQSFLSLNKSINEDNKMPDFQDFVDSYRSHFRLMELTKSTQAESYAKPPAPYRIDGQDHWYSECYYINESMRPPNWRPNRDLEDKRDQLLKTDKRFKAMIQKTEDRIKSKRNKANGSTDESSSSSAPTPPANNTLPPRNTSYERFKTIVEVVGAIIAALVALATVRKIVIDLSMPNPRTPPQDFAPTPTQQTNPKQSTRSSYVRPRIEGTEATEDTEAMGSS